MNSAVINDNRIVDISDYGVVIVKGIDAIKFLQGQVTCDVDALLSSANQRPSALGAHCTHKGRMLFTFRALSVDDHTIILIIYRALIPQVMQSLGKYIVFSKAALIDAQADYQLLGIQGKAVATVLKQCIPDLGEKANTVTVNDAMIVVSLGQQRYEIILRSEALSNEITACMDSLYAVCKPRGVDFWTLGNIQSGIGEVRPETVEEFIPQMLNLQVVGNGISFNKGCYTGQEVVARMKYLGKLKRQMYRLRLETEMLLPNPGDPVYSPSNQQPVGNVVIASQAGEYNEILAVVVNTVIKEDVAYIDEGCQHKLQLLPLPYVVS